VMCIGRPNDIFVAKNTQNAKEHSDRLYEPRKSEWHTSNNVPVLINKTHAALKESAVGAVRSGAVPRYSASVSS
jgi:hypothetical protein